MSESPEVIERALAIQRDRRAAAEAAADAELAARWGHEEVVAFREECERAAAAAPRLTAEQKVRLRQLFKPTVAQQAERDQQVRDDLAEAQRQLRGERMNSSVTDRLSGYAKGQP